MLTSASPLHLHWKCSASRPRRVAVAQLDWESLTVCHNSLMSLIIETEGFSTVFTFWLQLRSPTVNAPSRAANQCQRKRNRQIATSLAALWWHP